MYFDPDFQLSEIYHICIFAYAEYLYIHNTTNFHTSIIIKNLHFHPTWCVLCTYIYIYMCFI